MLGLAVFKKNISISECGLQDDKLPIYISPSYSGGKSTLTTPIPEEELSDFSVGDEEGQSLSKTPFKA